MLQGYRKHVPNGQDEATTAARAGLRSTEKMLAIQRTSSSQVGLDDNLKALVSCCQSQHLFARVAKRRRLPTHAT